LGCLETLACTKCGAAKAQPIDGCPTWSSAGRRDYLALLQLACFVLFCSVGFEGSERTNF
jgi:hypothetical protein